MMALQDRVSMRVERADFDDLVTLVTQAPTWEKERLAGIRVLLRSIADGQARCTRPDSRALDVAARARDAQGAGSSRVERVPRGETAARRARELARPPARGERCATRQDVARAADSGRRRAARIGRGLHAALDEADRRGARAARSRARSRACARGEPARAETAAEQAPPPAPQEEAAGRRGGCRAERQRRPRQSPNGEPGAKPKPRRRRRKPKPAVPASVGSESTNTLFADASNRARHRERCLAPPTARPPGPSAASSGSSSSSSRSRRNRVSSAASVSPDGRFSSAFSMSTRRSRSSTYDAVSASEETASLTCSLYSSAACSSSVDVDVDLQQLGEPAHERERRTRARRERDVMRNSGPEAERRDAVAAARVEQDSDDAGRAFVARRLEPELRPSARSSAAAAVTGAGRVCGTSASSDPNVTARSTPRSRARPRTSSEKVFQRRFGSVPSRITASRPAPGISQWKKLFSGHSSLRIIPSSSVTCGRVAWKS